MRTKTTTKTTETTRCADYTPQPGNKAVLKLADFTDENLFAELRRRGFTGNLNFTKSIVI